MKEKKIIKKWLRDKLGELCLEIQCEVSLLPKDVIEGKIFAIKETLSFIDSLQENPKGKCQGCDNVKGCITCVDGSECAHIEEAKVPKVFKDMLNAKTPAESLGISQEKWNKIEEECVFGKEEPVSIDFEQELYKAFGQVKDFTLGMQIAKWFYDMGKNSQEPVSEKLEEAAKKHSMASLEGHVVDDWVVEDFKAGANWQKKQVIEKAVEFFENDLCCYIKAQCFTIEHGRLENDFRKHIEED